MIELTEYLTKLSGTITYYFCYGTWENNDNHINDCEITPFIERGISYCISITVLADESNILYDFVKHNIREIKDKYKLEINHIQETKTKSSVYNFIV